MAGHRRPGAASQSGETAAVTVDLVRFAPLAVPISLASAAPCRRQTPLQALLLWRKPGMDRQVRLSAFPRRLSGIEDSRHASRPRL